MSPSAVISCPCCKRKYRFGKAGKCPQCGRFAEGTEEVRHPRFVWGVGAYREICPAYAKLPIHPSEMKGAAILWDAQEQQPVVTLHEQYAQSICLEDREGPYTMLETWLNELSNEALKSEGIMPTLCEVAREEGK